MLSNAFGYVAVGFATLALLPSTFARPQFAFQSSSDLQFAEDLGLDDPNFPPAGAVNNPTESLSAWKLDTTPSGWADNLPVATGSPIVQGSESVIIHADEATELPVDVIPTSTSAPATDDVFLSMFQRIIAPSRTTLSFETFTMTSCGRTYETSAVINLAEDCPEGILCPFGVWAFDGLRYQCVEDHVKAIVTQTLTDATHPMKSVPGVGSELRGFTDMASVPASILCAVGDWVFVGLQWVCVPHTKTVFTTPGEPDSCSARVVAPTSVPDKFQGHFVAHTISAGMPIATTVVAPTTTKTTSFTTLTSYAATAKGLSTSTRCNSKGGSCTVIVNKPYITITTTLAAGRAAFTSIVSNSDLVVGIPSTTSKKTATITHFADSLSTTAVATWTGSNGDEFVIIKEPYVRTTEYMYGASDEPYTWTTNGTIFYELVATTSYTTIPSGSRAFTSISGSKVLIGTHASIPPHTTTTVFLHSPDDHPSTDTKGNLVIIRTSAPPAVTKTTILPSSATVFTSTVRADGNEPNTVIVAVHAATISATSTSTSTRTLTSFKTTTTTTQSSTGSDHYVWSSTDWYYYPATVSGEASATYSPAPFSKSTAAAKLPKHELHPYELACPVNQGTTYAGNYGGRYQIECYVDRSGGDMTAGATESAENMEECILRCEKTKGCVDVSYIPSDKKGKGLCYLKSEVGMPFFSPDTIGARQIRPPIPQGEATVEATAKLGKPTTSSKAPSSSAKSTATTKSNTTKSKSTTTTKSKSITKSTATTKSTTTVTKPKTSVITVPKVNLKTTTRRSTTTSTSSTKSKTSLKPTTTLQSTTKATPTTSSKTPSKVEAVFKANPTTRSTTTTTHKHTTSTLSVPEETGTTWLTCPGAFHHKSNVFRIVVYVRHNRTEEPVYYLENVNPNGVDNVKPVLGQSHDNAAIFYFDATESSISIWHGGCEFSGLGMEIENPFNPVQPVSFSLSHIGTPSMVISRERIDWHDRLFGGWLLCNDKDLKWYNELSSEEPGKECKKVELQTLFDV